MKVVREEVDVIATRDLVQAKVSRSRRRWQVSDRDQLTVSVTFSHPVP
jgi:hypothetical protein